MRITTRHCATLIESVNRELNAEIFIFARPFNKLFQVLHFSSTPTINFAVLTYKKAFELAKLCRNDYPALRLQRKSFEGSWTNYLSSLNQQPTTV